MTVQGVTPQVGDWLRCTSDLWEGLVVELDDEAGLITLEMHDGRVRGVGPDEVLFNSWDPRLNSAASPVTP